MTKVRYLMKHKLFAALLAAALLLTTACGGGSAPTGQEDDTLHILATTYPVYLFTTAVTEGVEGVEVTRLITEEVSCLHDYTLSVSDMKAIEAADVIVMNGAGLEDFMNDALARSEAAVIDCSEGVELLPATGHHDHDPDEEEDGDHYDPHFWLDPGRAARMVENIQAGLSLADPDRTDTYQENLATAQGQLRRCDALLKDILCNDQRPLAGRELITFHDGFQYFADAYDLIILKAIEEEEGAEASAAEIREIVDLIKEHDLPVIFTERNGSESTAQAIARETGCAVVQLDLLMSDSGVPDVGILGYWDAIEENAIAIFNGFAGEEIWS